MRLLFVNWAYENHGSAQDLYAYAQVAPTLGHEVVLYGPPDPASRFNYSREIASADAVIFIFEFTTYLPKGDYLDFARLVAQVPRERRVVIDCDGKYNDAISIVGDLNHPDAAASQHWVEICDSLADKIYQPTLHPRRPNVRPFFFHGHDPAWERPLDVTAKPYGMVYVGNNWFRWRALQRVLQAVEPIRAQLGRIALVGNGWASPPPWANPTLIEEAYRTEPAYLEALGIECIPPVPFEQVIPWMSQGVFSPVIYRPLFDHLRLVTCRTFETPAANTIPLFGLDADYVQEIYGDAALELVLPQDQPEEKILDILGRPEHYAEIVQRIRRHCAAQHSYAARLQQLVQLIEE